MKTKIFITFLMILVILSLPTIVQGQPDPGGDVDVPIDGGLSILLAAGVAYGAKKIHDSRKKKSAPGEDPTPEK